jgi:hypothetical protein
MYLTREHQLGGKNRQGVPEDLSFIVRYSWESSKHMKEAIKIMLSARLESAEEFARHRDGETTVEQREVQIRLASNPETSEEVLSYLSKIGDSRVCARIAMNPRCPEAALTALANHPDAEVREELAENVNCTITILYRLTKDKHPDVRLRLAENANLPLSILEELREDENPFVAARAAETLRKSSAGTVTEGKFPTYGTSLKVVAS